MRRVLVTRPAEQAEDWVRRLQAEGFDAAALPLIGVAPLADGEPLARAWRGLAQRDLLMFVSPNAVAHFFACRPAGAAWPPTLAAAAPGPGTAAALRAQGVARVVEPAADAPTFDSESLWAVLRTQGPWAGRSVLLLRGSASAGGGEAHAEGEGREWLMRTLREAGAQVDALATYRRGAPQWGPDEQAVWAQAQAAPCEQVWCFSSSEAIGHLQAAGAGARPWQGGVALVTHPRIAAAARRAGFDDVRELAPRLPDLVAALRALQGAPIQSAPS